MISLAAIEDVHASSVRKVLPDDETLGRCHLLQAIAKAEASGFHHYAQALLELYRRKFA